MKIQTRHENRVHKTISARDFVKALRSGKFKQINRDKISKIDRYWSCQKDTKEGTYSIMGVAAEIYRKMNRLIDHWDSVNVELDGTPFTEDFDPSVKGFSYCPELVKSCHHITQDQIKYFFDTASTESYPMLDFQFVSTKDREFTKLFSEITGISIDKHYVYHIFDLEKEGLTFEQAADLFEYRMGNYENKECMINKYRRLKDEKTESLV